jgi:hypothetical protein
VATDRGKFFDEVAGVGHREDVAKAEPAHAYVLLREEHAEHGPSLLRRCCAPKAHRSVFGERAHLAAHFLAGGGAEPPAYQIVEVGRQAAAVAVAG